jgi:hypothetical protein
MTPVVADLGDHFCGWHNHQYVLPGLPYSRKAETVRTVPISLTRWARAVAQYHIDGCSVCV